MVAFNQAGLTQEYQFKMRQDLRLVKNEDGLYDLAVVDGDFEAVNGFDTAILVSLFTDDRAQSFQVENAEKRRGWAGNVLTAGIGRSLGSLLWIYQQARLTQDIINQVEIEAEACLQWLIEDNQAKSVSATVTRENSRGIFILIDIVTTDGVNQKYKVLWRETFNAS